VFLQLTSLFELALMFPRRETGVNFGTAMHHLHQLFENGQRNLDSSNAWRTYIPWSAQPPGSRQRNLQSFMPSPRQLPRRLRRQLTKESSQIGQSQSYIGANLTHGLLPVTAHIPSVYSEYQIGHQTQPYTIANSMKQLTPTLGQWPSLETKQSRFHRKLVALSDCQLKPYSCLKRLSDFQ